MRLSPRAQRFLAILCGSLFAVAAAEIACRIDAFFPGAHFEPESARHYFEARAIPQAALQMHAYARPDAHLSEADALPYVHPFAGWTNASTDEYAAQMARDTASADDGFFDLLLIGGSVAGNLTVAGAPRLVQLLEADPRLRGSSVRVWSFARPSYRAPQPLAWVQWLLVLGARPDAVLSIDGFNEVAMALENSRRGLHPAYPSFRYWSGLVRGSASDPAVLDSIADVRLARRVQMAIARRALELGFHRSALLTRLTQARLRAAKRVTDEASSRLLEVHDLGAHRDVTLRGPPFAGDDRAAVELAIASWESAARALHVLCAERRIPSLQVVQPTLADAGSKRASSDEIRNQTTTPEWAEGVAIGYPVLRERARALAAAGLPVVDATRIFAEVEETRFVDVVHFDERGNFAIAEWIAPRLLARLP